MSEFTINNGAEIDGEYRYALWRSIAPLRGETLAGTVLWICLNPSTADATENDATVRKVIGFSRRWGFAHARIVNLFALRSRDPKALKTHPEPIGPRNDDRIINEVYGASAIVLAWGGTADQGPGQERAADVRRDVKYLASRRECPIWHLGLTKAGQPRHPLMLSYNTPRRETL